MIGRRLLVVIAIAAGAFSGALYFVSVQRVDVVVAAHDVDPPRPLTAADLEVRALSADAGPEGTLASVDEAVGMSPTAPLLRGQIVFRRALAADAPSFASGLSLPYGMRAVAIPVTPAQAVGGAVAPGAVVDVLAVPVPGRAPVERTTELLATDVLVLDVRSESGEPLAPAPSELAAAAERLGSVVVAVRASDAVWLADRIGTSTFVLALRRP